MPFASSHFDHQNMDKMVELRKQQEKKHQQACNKYYNQEKTRNSKCPHLHNVQKENKLEAVKEQKAYSGVDE